MTLAKFTHHKNIGALKSALKSCKKQNHYIISCNNPKVQELGFVCANCDEAHCAPMNTNKVTIVHCPDIATYLEAYQQHKGHQVYRADDPKRLHVGFTCLNCSVSRTVSFADENAPKSQRKQLWQLNDTIQHLPDITK